MNRRGFLSLAGLLALPGCVKPKAMAPMPPLYVVERSGTITLPPTSGYPVGTVILFRPTCENTGPVKVNSVERYVGRRCIIERTSKRWRIRT